METPIVFGSVSKVDSYNQSHGIQPERTEREKEMTSNANTTEFNIGMMVLDDDGKPTVLDSELQLLDNVLIRHNPEIVYMQESLDFYDKYYLEEVHVDDELTNEARKIRRIYREYPGYLYACYVRNKYMEELYKKYGANTDGCLNFMDNYSSALPNDVFVPPTPIYSRNAIDYEDVMNGTYDFTDDGSFEPPSSEELNDIIKQLSEHSDVDLSKVGIAIDVLTYLPAIKACTDDAGDYSSHYNGPSSVNVTDLDNLQRIIRSWNSSESKKSESASNRIPFPKSERGIREYYMNEAMYYLLDHMGKENEKDDENEMVYDEVTKKPMTRREYDQRCNLRLFAKSGWDMVKMMSQLNVGSKVERRLVQRKRRNKKISKRKAASFMNDIMGGDVDYGGSMVNSFDENAVMSAEELRNYLFDD